MKAPRILLVEDDLIDVKMIKRAFAELGQPVDLHVVNDGEEAIRFLGKRDKYADAPSIDLTLLDINMPKMNGREVLKALRDDPELARSIVIVLTSSEEDRDINSCYELGANSYIAKPTSLDGLTATLRLVFEFWFRTACRPRLE